MILSLEQEVALVADVLCGDRDAVRELHRYIDPWLARVVRESAWPGADLPNLQSNAWEHLWRENWRVLRVWSKTAPLRAYLRAVVRNLVRSQASGGRHAYRDEYEDLDSLPAHDATDNAFSEQEAVLLVMHILRCLQKGMERLGEREREVLRLRHESDFKHREIAELLEVNTRDVGTLLARAERRLKQSMSPACREVTEDYFHPPSLSRDGR